MSAAQREPVMFSDLGEAGLLCEHAPGPLDLSRQQRIWAVAETLGRLPAIREVVPGMNNLAVLYDPFAITPEALQARIKEIWDGPPVKPRAGRVLEIPVVYGGAAGFDLDALADGAGLAPAEFAIMHAAAEYTVYILGSQPGFAYLGGLPERLATPRRSIINPRVEGGSVIIGGAQTGVQSRTTPSGWHVIGRTEVVCFDPAAEPPTLLAPGDRVRFKILDILA